MRKTTTVAAIVIAGSLALAGCSSPAGSSTTGSNGVTQPVAAVEAGQSIPMVAEYDSAAVATQSAAASDVRLITAQAIGTVTGTPDVLTVSLGVQTTSTSANAALEENNRLATDVIAVIKSNGVAPEDLQTSQLSINPTYDDKGVVTGYQVSNQVTATLRDISTAGALIDAVGTAAGDAVRVNGLYFSIDDDSALRAQARADAVHRAQAQAQQMADAGGIQLGAIHSITESPTYQAYDYAQAPMAAASAGAASVPLEAGSQELTVTVQVVYEIAG